jgi:hypothetical protein
VALATLCLEEVRPCVSPLLDECMGVRWCLAWILEKHFANAIIETYAEIVAKRLYGGPLQAKIECLDYLSKLLNVSVCSVSRECNAVVHSVVNMSGCRMWKGCTLLKEQKLVREF